MRFELLMNRVTKCDLPDPDGPATMAENGCFHFKSIIETDTFIGLQHRDKGRIEIIHGYSVQREYIV